VFVGSLIIFNHAYSYGIVSLLKCVNVV